MDKSLKTQRVCMTEWGLNSQTECPISGDCTLPEYCPDVAAVLKCTLSARMESRQRSGGQLLVDGTACARILYLDEGRRCVRSAEFALPFSCSFQMEGNLDTGLIDVDFQTKYANCRAVSPRHLEIRGAVIVTARSTVQCEKELIDPEQEKGLHTQCETVAVSETIAASEKVITIQESLDFPPAFPSAAMLLGGECRCVVQECKLLSGKAIVKGQIYVHQLYTSNLDSGETEQLDFTVPFSQIMDIDGAEDGGCCTATAKILADTERCVVGPDGGNTVLELMVKLLIQVQTYRTRNVPLLTDAYHTRYPVTKETEEIASCHWVGNVREYTMLPIPIALPTKGVSELVDVWLSPQDIHTVCQNGIATITGHMTVCTLLKEEEGTLSYYEQTEPYSIEVACSGNRADAQVMVTECRNRLVETTLELQVGLCVTLTAYMCQKHQVVCNLTWNEETPYPASRVTAKVYYAQPGENVWDIGRECHASIESIQLENGLNDCVITKPSVLLIPCQ